MQAHWYTFKEKKAQENSNHVEGQASREWHHLLISDLGSIQQYYIDKCTSTMQMNVFQVHLLNVVEGLKQENLHASHLYYKGSIKHNGL